MLNYTHRTLTLYTYICYMGELSLSDAAAVCRNSRRRLPPITARRVAHVVRRFFSHNNIITISYTISLQHYNNIIHAHMKLF